MATLLLLHGALANRRQFTPLLPLLKPELKAIAIDFSGHGEKKLAGNFFSLERFCEDMIEAGNREPVHLFGYSMGGYAALYFAKKYPELVLSVLTLGTKYQWNKETAVSETKRLQYDILVEKAPGFITALTEQHACTTAPELLNRTTGFLTHLGEHDYLRPEVLTDIKQPVCVAVGDRDKMVTLEETIACYKALPKGQLAVLPDTPHLFEKMDMTRVAALANGFFR
ncbi:MAG: alpha/beta fold hydrolase [Bacteroidia bacterium]|nr:alpha/beta fold hydrolase [Bacteroidia bacterium]